MTVFVNAIMYYKVRDATLAVSRVDDYGGSSRLLSATTLRNVLGTKVRYGGNGRDWLGRGRDSVLSREANYK